METQQLLDLHDFIEYNTKIVIVQVKHSDRAHHPSS